MVIERRCDPSGGAPHPTVQHVAKQLVGPITGPSAMTQRSGRTRATQPNGTLLGNSASSSASSLRSGGARCRACALWHHCQVRPPALPHRASRSGSHTLQDRRRSRSRPTAGPVIVAERGLAALGGTYPPLRKTGAGVQPPRGAITEKSPSSKVFSGLIFRSSNNARPAGNTRAALISPCTMKAARRLLGITSAPRKRARLMIFLACGLRS